MNNQTNNNQSKPIIIGIGILVALFLVYRGMIFANCRATDCAAYAEKTNPFPGMAKNTLGQAFCEEQKKSCRFF